MAYTLESINQAIRERARAEAKTEAQAAVNAMPYWSKDLIFIKDGHNITVERWKLVGKLREAIEEEFYQDKVTAHTQKILESVDQLEFLRESVEQLKGER